MDTFQSPSVRQIGQVAADGLQRHTEMRGQTFDRYFALTTRDFQNFGMAKGLGHLRRPFSFLRGRKRKTP